MGVKLAVRFLAFAHMLASVSFRIVHLVKDDEVSEPFYDFRPVANVVRTALAAVMSRTVTDNSVMDVYSLHDRSCQPTTR